MAKISCRIIYYFRHEQSVSSSHFDRVIFPIAKENSECPSLASQIGANRFTIVNPIDSQFQKFNPNVSVLHRTNCERTLHSQF